MHPPKTLSRWVRLTLIANGIRDDLPLEDAIGVAIILQYTKRTIPLQQFDERVIYERQRMQHDLNF